MMLWLLTMPSTRGDPQHECHYWRRFDCCQVGTHLLFFFSPCDEVVPCIYSHGLHAMYLDIHQESREYSQKVRDVNERNRIKGKPPFRQRTVEENKFQDPQISSHKPLVWNPYLFDFVFRLTTFHKDMNRLWEM